MIRLVLFLFLLAAIAFGASWVADRPGEITVVWQGWQVETSVPVALVTIAITAGVLLLLWRLLVLLLDIPTHLASFSRKRKREKGWKAVTRGLLAIGTGDGATARRARAEAVRLLPDEPLTHLLTAQEAQFEGEHEVAVATFQAMAEEPETRLLGLRGLHIEARKAGHHEAAAAFAAQAAEAAPTLNWAADAVIEARCGEGDFAGAMAVLERQMAKKGIDKAQYRRRRAVLLTAEALALEETDPAVARERSVEAVRLAPTLVPAAACAGRLLGANGQMRKASKIVETAYAATPHPELAETEAFLRPGDSAQDRLKRIRTLVARAPDHTESAIALAHAAIDAHEFAEARTALAPLLEQPTQRVCMMMAELEAAEHADIGKAREWAARAVNAARDPAWIADGVVAERWAALSPTSGKLDMFVWAVPPGVATTPLLEHEAERVKAAIAAIPAPMAGTVATTVEGAVAPKADEADKTTPGKTATDTTAPAETTGQPVADEALSKTPETGAPSVYGSTGDDRTADDTASVPAQKATAPEDIVAMPPLPDDPGPEPEDETQSVTDKRRIFGL
ncbi:MAG: heme biosynthesis protein HemY [Xanthobacter sp.]